MGKIFKVDILQGKEMKWNEMNSWVEWFTYLFKSVINILVLAKKK